MEIRRFLRSNIDFSNKRKPARLRIIAPQYFTLIHPLHRRKLLDFIDQLRRASCKVTAITLDFVNIKRLHPCGALLFVAELDRILQSQSRRCTIRATRPGDHIVEQVFQHIGLLNRLGLDNRLNISHRRVRNWSLHSGKDVNLEALMPVKEKLELHLGEDLAFDLLSAMQEAITNAVHHAYLRPRNDGINTNEGWWLFSEYDDEDNIVYLSVCDLGIGIRRSLPLIGTWTSAAVASILKRLGVDTARDAKYIKAAIELGATRTGRDNRGKGLHEMLELVKDAQSGGLRIFSDHGMFTHSGERGTEKILDYGGSIKGTLIQWSFNAKSTGIYGSREHESN